VVDEPDAAGLAFAEFPLPSSMTRLVWLPFEDLPSATAVTAVLDMKYCCLPRMALVTPWLTPLCIAFNAQQHGESSAHAPMKPTFVKMNIDKYV
jgi:hypothetical protein